MTANYPFVFICCYCIYLVLFVDADFDSPLQPTGSGGSQQFVPDEGSMSMIESMGFTRRQATAALKATVRTWHCMCISPLYSGSL